MQALDTLSREIFSQRDPLTARVALALSSVMSPLNGDRAEDFALRAGEIAFTEGYASAPHSGMSPLLAGEYDLAHMFREGRSDRVWDEEYGDRDTW